jgi:hypothetical protein
MAEVGFVDEPLPGGEGIADAMAAYREEVAADAAPVVRVGYSTATPEPDWIAEEDLLVIAAPVEGAPMAAASHATTADVIASQAAEPEDAVAEEVLPEAVADQDVAVDAVADAADALEPLAAVAPPVAFIEADEPEPTLTEADDDEPPAPSDSDYLWLEDPEADPAPRIAAIAIGEPDPSPDVAEPATPDPSRARMPIEIATEPPAPDDVALLVGPAAFSEPPQIPQEPAFWEAGARARAPFAVPHMDAWEASASEAMRVTTEPEAPADAPAIEASLEAPPPVVVPHEARTSAWAPATERPEPAWPEVEVGWGSTPESSESSTSAGSPTEPSASASPAAARPRPAARRRRGPAARAIRRLRILLD